MDINITHMQRLLKETYDRTVSAGEFTTFGVSIGKMNLSIVKPVFREFAKENNLILDYRFGLGVDTAEFTIPDTAYILKRLESLLGTLKKEACQVAIDEFLRMKDD